MIKREKIEMDSERRILAYMITDTKYLTNLQGIALPKYFSSRFVQTIARWVWEYFSITSQAPGRMVEEIFRKTGSYGQD